MKRETDTRLQAASQTYRSQKTKKGKVCSQLTRAKISLLWLTDVTDVTLRKSGSSRLRVMLWFDRRRQRYVRPKTNVELTSIASMEKDQKRVAKIRRNTKQSE